MIPIKKITTVDGVDLRRELFSLPIGGCRLVSTEWLNEKEYCRVRGWIAYYESVKKLWSEKELDSFLRFYLVPGYGHGCGEDFMMGTSIVEMLDKWVSLGQGSENMIVSDELQEHNGRIMTISRYSG